MNGRYSKYENARIKKQGDEVGRDSSSDFQAALLLGYGDERQS